MCDFEVAIKQNKLLILTSLKVQFTCTKGVLLLVQKSLTWHFGRHPTRPANNETNHSLTTRPCRLLSEANYMLRFKLQTMAH